MNKGGKVKCELVALRLTEDELAQVDTATASLAGGALEPSRSQMMRLLLRLGLARFNGASVEERARLVLLGGHESEPSKPSNEEQLRAELALKRKVEADLDAAERQARIDEGRREAERMKEEEAKALKERLNRPVPKVWRTDDPNNPSAGLLRPRR